METHCPECGASWCEGETCQDCFHQMLFWEAENPKYGVVHHLMVLCYHLQHPSLYSPEGLNEAKRLLIGFVKHGVSPVEVHQRARTQVDSGQRKWKIKGTSASHGSYQYPIRWTKTAADVIASGVNNYCGSVRAWAQSVYVTLQASGNLALD